MSVSPEDRRHLLERIAEVTDERAARTMSELFDEEPEEDPGILARFDQQDAELADHGRRLRALEAHMQELRDQLGGVQGELAGVHGELAGVHGELGSVQGELGSVVRGQEQILEILDLKLDLMRNEVLATFRGEIQAAITGQWRTVLLGTATFALLLVATAVTLSQLL